MHSRPILALPLLALGVLSFGASRGIAQHRPLPAPADISGPLNFQAQPFDVLHYDAWIDLTKAPSREMSGICEMRVRWSGDPTSGPFYFHLRDLRVDSAYYNGIPVTAMATGDKESATYHYRITPPANVETGDTAVIRVVYSGTMEREYGGGTWGGVTASGGTLFALGVGFSNNYVSATQHWLPCYDHPSDKATFRGRFRVKKEKAVASNGLVTIVPESDSTVIYDWNHTFLCSTYLLTFAVDNYVPVDFPGETPPMVVYSRPQDSAATRTTFKLLPQMVRGFEGRFGTYPFEKVGYVNTPLGAMEHQTMVSFPTSLSRARDTVNSTGAHELAHQWFGDLVSPLDFRHAWLNESFATFCESVWIEELAGWEGYLRSQESKANQYINTISRNEGILPLYDFPRESPSSNYPATIYQKGAVVVGMLRYELGDSIFYAAMRTYLERHAYSTATTDDLRSILEEHAGRPLGWFFDQWVNGRGWPVLKVNVTAVGGNRVQVSLEQTQADSLPTFTNLPVEIGFEGDGGATAYRMIRMTDRTMTVTLDSVPSFSTVTVNRGPSVRALLRATSAISSVHDRQRSNGADGIGFFVRPNPASRGDEWSVEAKGFANCDGVTYEIFDSVGRHITRGTSSTCGFTLPDTGLSSGAYMLRFNMRGTYYDVPVIVR